MIEVRCPDCGAEFRLEDPMAGRKARCARCKAVIAIGAAPRGEQGPVVLDHAAGAPERGKVMRRRGLPTTDPSRGFWADAAMSFYVHFRPRSVFIFLCVTAMILLRNYLRFAGCIGGAGQLILSAMLAGYYLNLIQSTCAGEDDLPPFAIDNAWDGMVSPFLEFAGSWLWAALPALVWGVLMLGGAVTFGGAIFVEIGLALLAVFIWPMTILTVAVNGFSLDALRYDLQVGTIARNLPSYLAVCLMLAAAVALMVVGVLVSTGVSAFGVGLGVKGLAAAATLGWVLPAIEAHATIAVMRIVGLFYRHNKDHFLWVAE